MSSSLVTPLARPGAGGGVAVSTPDSTYRPAADPAPRVTAGGKVAAMSCSFATSLGLSGVGGGVAVPTEDSTYRPAARLAYGVTDREGG